MAERQLEYRSRLHLTSTRVNRAEEDLDEENTVVKVEVQGEVYVVGALVECRPAKLAQPR